MNSNSSFNFSNCENLILNILHWKNQILGPNKNYFEIENSSIIDVNEAEVEVDPQQFLTANSVQFEHSNNIHDDYLEEISENRVEETSKSQILIVEQRQTDSTESRGKSYITIDDIRG